jgi:hypothetical protein
MKPAFLADCFEELQDKKAPLKAIANAPMQQIFSVLRNDNSIRSEQI